MKPARLHTALDTLSALISAETDECIEWPFAVSSNGYGKVWHKKRAACAHRVACEMTYGPPPDPRLDAAHSCGNRKCVNPAHLRWATRSENNIDFMRHRRRRTAISAEQAVEIRERLERGEARARIARSLGVRGGIVADIAIGRTWWWA